MSAPPVLWSFFLLFMIISLDKLHNKYVPQVMRILCATEHNCANLVLISRLMDSKTTFTMKR